MIVLSMCPRWAVQDGVVRSFAGDMAIAALSTRFQWPQCRTGKPVSTFPGSAPLSPEGSSVPRTSRIPGTLSVPGVDGRAVEPETGSRLFVTR